MVFIVKLLQFFASLSLLVIIHEFGHFITARMCKMRVDKFYLFFNPWFTLFKFKSKRSGTEYGVGWLPLGGYVKIAGMIDESMDNAHLKQEAQPWEFRSHPAWQRLIVIVAGVFNNFILALGIYAAILFMWGETYLPMRNVTAGMEFSEYACEIGFQNGDILLRADSTELVSFDSEGFRAIANAKRIQVLRDGNEVWVDMPEDFMERMLETKAGFANYRYPFVVDSVLPGSRAEWAGLQRGDSLVGLVNDSLSEDAGAVYSSEFMTAFSANRNIPLLVRVMRGGEEIELTLTPDCDGRVGVLRKPLSAFYRLEKREYSLLASIPAGVKKGVSCLTGYVSDMKYVFSKAGAESLGGFVSIGGLFPYPFHAESFWEITAFLSVILAFMNILPIPALDGGHAVFILYEIITRRKPSERVVMSAQMIGMMLLLLLLIFANMNDFFRLFR